MGTEGLPEPEVNGLILSAITHYSS